MPTMIKSPRYNATLAIVAFAVSAICFSGLVLGNDLVGRLIFGFVWIFGGVMWLGQYIQARKERGSDRHFGAEPK